MKIVRAQPLTTHVKDRKEDAGWKALLERIVVARSWNAKIDHHSEEAVPLFVFKAGQRYD